MLSMNTSLIAGYQLTCC